MRFKNVLALVVVVTTWVMDPIKVAILTLVATLRCQRHRITIREAGTLARSSSRIQGWQHTNTSGGPADALADGEVGRNEPDDTHEDGMHEDGTRQAEPAAEPTAEPTLLTDIDENGRTVMFF